jgi:hypothetical protein
MKTYSQGSIETEEERLRKVNELAAELGPNWADAYEPGSHGCHELLDRTNLIGDNLEHYVLEHPACMLNPEWYALAEKAVSALRELYQRVGAEH